jgi:GDPmannose 4,6-dehydratase
VQPEEVYNLGAQSHVRVSFDQPIYTVDVVATGKMISVRTFCELAFGQVGLDYKDFVEVDPRYFRPAEVEQLLGDPSKAMKKLGWKPKCTVEQLAKMMVETDMELARREKTLRDAGHKLPAMHGHDQ